MHDRRRSVGVGGLQKGGVWSVCIVCVRGVFDIKIIAGIVCCRRRPKQKKKKRKRLYKKKTARRSASSCCTFAAETAKVEREGAKQV